MFAQQPHNILIKQVQEYEHLSVAGSQLLDIDSKNLYLVICLDLEEVMLF